MRGRVNGYSFFSFFPLSFVLAAHKIKVRRNVTEAEWSKCFPPDNRVHHVRRVVEHERAEARDESDSEQ